MSRTALYITCVTVFALPIAGVWILVWSVFGFSDIFHEDLRPYAIVALAFSVSMILGGLPGR